MYCMILVQNPVYYRQFRHIQAYMFYSYIFSYIVAYLKLFVTLAYSEPCHIQNPGIYRTQHVFRSLSRHILAYSEDCVTRILRTLSYSEFSHIKNFGIFRILGMSESCLFRHDQAYSRHIQ